MIVGRQDSFLKKVDPFSKGQLEKDFTEKKIQHRRKRCDASVTTSWKWNRTWSSPRRASLCGPPSWLNYWDPWCFCRKKESTTPKWTLETHLAMQSKFPLKKKTAGPPSRAVQFFWNISMYEKNFGSFSASSWYLSGAEVILKIHSVSYFSI